MRYTDEQLKDFARQVIEHDASNPDFMGIAEQFEDEWTDLPADEFEQVHRRVHDLACSATITVTWDEPTAPAPADVDHAPYIAAVADALDRVTWLNVTYWHAGDPAPRGGYIEVDVVGRSLPLGLGWDEEHGWICGRVADGGMSNPMDMGLDLVASPQEVVQAVRLRLVLPAEPGRYRDADELDPELERALAAYLRDGNGPTDG